MSDWLWALAVIPSIIAAVVALLWLRERRHAGNLDALLDTAHARLESLQLQFERFAPDSVIEQLTDGHGRPRPERKTVTVLFADLLGFTSLADRLDPSETLDILNGYFRVMTEAIATHHGRVTELTGDGLLALFGALEPNPWQTPDAVIGALAMRRALARYNERLHAEGRPALRFGIGIHRGEVLAGVMGNEDLSKFGVVGDPINVASRVEGLTRVHGVDLLVTEEVRAALDPRFRLRAMPPQTVKGKSEPIVTYFVEGLEEESGAPSARREGVRG